MAAGLSVEFLQQFKKWAPSNLANITIHVNCGKVPIGFYPADGGRPPDLHAPLHRLNLTVHSIYNNQLWKVCGGGSGSPSLSKQKRVCLLHVYYLHITYESLFLCDTVLTAKEKIGEGTVRRFISTITDSGY